MLFAFAPSSLQVRPCLSPLSTHHVDVGILTAPHPPCRVFALDSTAQHSKAQHVSLGHADQVVPAPLCGVEGRFAGRTQDRHSSNADGAGSCPDLSITTVIACMNRAHSQAHDVTFTPNVCCLPLRARRGGRLGETNPIVHPIQVLMSHFAALYRSRQLSLLPL